MTILDWLMVLPVSLGIMYLVVLIEDFVNERD